MWFPVLLAISIAFLTTKTSVWKMQQYSESYGFIRVLPHGNRLRHSPHQSRVRPILPSQRSKMVWLASRPDDRLHVKPNIFWNAYRALLWVSTPVYCQTLIIYSTPLSHGVSMPGHCILKSAHRCMTLRAMSGSIRFCINLHADQ